MIGQSNTNPAAQSNSSSNRTPSQPIQQPKAVNSSTQPTLNSNQGYVESQIVRPSVAKQNFEGNSIKTQPNNISQQQSIPKKTYTNALNIDRDNNNQSYQQNQANSYQQGTNINQGNVKSN